MTCATRAQFSGSVSRTQSSFVKVKLVSGGLQVSWIRVSRPNKARPRASVPRSQRTQYPPRVDWRTQAPSGQLVHRLATSLADPAPPTPAWGSEMPRAPPDRKPGPSRLRPCRAPGFRLCPRLSRDKLCSLLDSVPQDVV